MKDKISIIVTLCDYKNITNTLKSILEQTYTNIELIIVDNVLSYDIYATLNDFLKKHKKKYIYIYNTKTKDILKSRILGIQNATGKYILYINSGDIILPKTCEYAQKIAEKYNADIVDFIHCSNSAQHIIKLNYNLHKTKIIYNNDIINYFYERKIMWSTWGKLYRKERVLQAIHNLNIPANDEIDKGEGFIFIFTICCIAHVYVSYKNIEINYFHVNETLTDKNFYDLNFWKKISLDLSISRKICLGYLKNINLDDNTTKFERIYSLFFKEYFELVNKNLPDYKKDYFISILLDSVHPGVLVDLFGKNFYKLLCSAINKKNIKIQRNISTIAIFSHSLNGGGSERVASILANKFIDLGFKIYLIIKEGQNEFSYYTDPRIHILYLTKQDYQYQYLAELIIKEDIDLCIFNDHWIENNFIEVLVAQLCKVYTVCIEHSMFYFPFYANNINLFSIRNSVYKNCSALVTLSDCQLQIWKDAGIHKTVHINNPLTFDNNIIKTKGEEKIILYVGRLNEDKGAIDAIYVL